MDFKLEQESNVRKSSGAVIVTIPSAFAKLMNIENGGTIRWTYDPGKSTDSVTITVVTDGKQE